MDYLSEINELVEELWPRGEYRSVVTIRSDSLGTDVQVDVEGVPRVCKFDLHPRVALSETWLELLNLKREQNGY